MLCPIHQVEFKLVPAGTSKKTGKPYKAFYVCQVAGCGERPKMPATAPQNANSSPTGSFSQGLDGLKAVEDGQNQGKRMNRSNLAGRAISGYIAQHNQIPWIILSELESWVDTGKIPNLDK